MGEGNLYCLTSQRVERWERMGEDVAGVLDGKGRRGALLALQSTGFASSVRTVPSGGTTPVVGTWAEFGVGVRPEVGLALG